MVKIWDASSGECLQTLEGHSDYVTSVAFSPDSALVASASDDKTAKIWDASSGECIWTLEESTWVNSVTFSHNSTLLALALVNNTVRIWDVSNGKCIQRLEGHDSSVTSVAFSHDLARLASASDDVTVKIWDASSGECLQTFRIGRALESISFDVTDLYLHTEFGIIDISALSSLFTLPTGLEPYNPEYRGLALSSDRVWITYDSENLVWLPVEYRPLCSAMLRKAIGIGDNTGRVWICNVHFNAS